MMSILEKLDHFRIPLEDIKQATNNFSRENIIGPGGYGMVYKGELLCSNVLTKIAAKQVDRSIIFAEQHFLNEIRVFSSYRHVNIISFIGFCDESNEMILVQKFVAYKGLDNCLSNAKLKWLQRLQICLGVAHGLNYLQNGVEGHSVIHRDIRSRNILLDQSLQPQIARFGHSIMDSMHHTIDHEGIRGRPAYMDPTFLQTGIVTKESDIYSFGVVLFEVLCGRLAYETNEENEKQSLGPLARLHYETGRLNEIIDPILRNTMNPDSLESFSAIAYQCLETRQSHRPTMIQVVEKLEQVMSLQQEFDKALALQQVAQDLKRKQEDDHECYKVKNLEHMKIPLEQIKLATNDFHDDCLIGRGGYGKVYKADLFHFDVHKHVKAEKNIVSIELSGFDRRKSTVAVKRLDRRYGQGTAQFLQEISVLPYFKHQNLVTLLGFCDEGHERILVSEYASKGSLEEYICSTDSSKNHTWTQCLQICLDAAHGLEFLHNGVGEYHRIIHRDIKSSNILLSGNGVGKISDFGLSRIGPANLQATFVMTQVAGTLEYVDPQYNKTGMLTKESDVYSFGVVLFEVLCGRLAYFPRSKDDQEFLPHMAKRCFEQKKLYEIIDPKLKKELEKGFGDETCPDSISIFAAIAYKCLQKNRDDRPTMAEVVEELEKASKSHVKGVEGLRVSLDSIRFATNDFSHVIEQEGYHKVYRGELSYSKGHNAVTVKRFKPIVGSYGNKFDKVIAMLYSYCHKNIIPLLGFCEEAGERIAVFQHMANGSLKGHVKNPSLTWKQRLKICVDASHGIAHIHSAADAQHSIHGDIKSSIILLNHDWKAFISDFIIPKGVGTLGYYDPIYATTGIVTQKSDVYSFGVVLFEILSGRLAIETITIDKPQPLNGGEDAQVTFLSQWVAQCFKKERLEDIIFHGIKEQIDGKSLVIFSTIAYQCLQQKLEDRPTMDEVLKELEKALKCQDEWEWEQKLPKDYKKIIHMSKYSVSNISTKKDIHSILYSGILLHNEKQWFSISMDGVKNVVISATKFSYKNVKWRSIRKSRFPKVAKISDVSNLNIQINAKTQYLTPEIMYGAYLVFKFCDRRKVSNRPLYVNLKYKKSGKTLNAYFAEWSAGNNWLTVELFRFWNDKENIEFDVLLDSFSRYHCGSGGIFIEGIAFQAIHINIVNCSENVELNDGKNTGHLKNVSTLDLADELMAVDCREIINRSENNIGNAPKEELYLFLLEGILIDNGQKIFSISKRDRKKCHMLPATAVIYDHSDMKSYERKPRAQFRCRFEEFVEILSRHEFRIRCDVETKLLSSDTVYACFLVFMLPESCQRLKPVKARDLLPYKKERTKIISFTSPSMVNLDKIKWIPKQRKDGWMEVRVWETNCDVHNDDFIPMDLKLISFEGTMSGLMVCGIEFRTL